MSKELKKIGLNSRPLICRESCDSTNRVAELWLSSWLGGPGAVVVSDVQTHGKGRLGREWVSESGLGLLFTVVMLAPQPLSAAPKAVLMWAAAMAKAANKVRLGIIIWVNTFLVFSNDAINWDDSHSKIKSID